MAEVERTHPVTAVSRRPTIHDVAAKAAVSRGTVDRALHDRPGVNRETATLIKRVAREIGYTSNNAARALHYNTKPREVTVLLPARNREFVDRLENGVFMALQELKDMGITVKSMRLDPQKEEEILQTLTAAVRQESAGIVVSTIDTPRITRALDRAIGSGIPVITLNSDVSESRRLCFVGQDLINSGLVAAELMAKLLAGRSGRILAIMGNRDFEAHRDRISGFEEGIARWGSQLRVVVRESYSTYEGTMSCLEEEFSREYLVDQMPIIGIYMATGINEACLDFVQGNNKKGRVRIITNDESTATVRGLREGTIDFTICQDPEQQGYMALKTMFGYLQSRTPPETRWYQTPVRIVGAAALSAGNSRGTPPPGGNRTDHPDLSE